MPFLALGGAPLWNNHLFRTLAPATDSGKEPLVIMAVLLACVVNGDTVTGVLRQATWLVVAVIILLVVQLVAPYLPQPRVKPAADV
ncbi:MULTISPECIES: hypothetical protein [Streptomyces]|uniref:hypothetical protein n=1 Tax=Streptomyces TaxID=1883 RepID=UPI001678019C|nr:hypothetical protein OG872_16830 [Streptomyces althioticus]GGQ03577.1 hypothetical protein GCM10010233_20200 [Streptomyces gancidicus]